MRRMNWAERPGRKLLARDFDEFQRDIDKWLRKLEMQLPAFYKRAAEIAAMERKKGFMRSEGPDGERWKPLHPKTIEQKSGGHGTSRMKTRGGISGLSSSRAKASKHPSKPLIDTGNLMNATTKADRKGGYVMLARSRSEPVTGGGDSISGIHHKGKGNVDARPHWGIYKQARKKIEKMWELVVKDFVKGLARG